MGRFASNLTGLPWTSTQLQEVINDDLIGRDINLMFEFEQAMSKANEQSRADMYSFFARKIVQIHSLIDGYGMMLVNKHVGKGNGLKQSLGEQMKHYDSPDDEMDEVEGHAKTLEMLMRGELRLK